MIVNLLLYAAYLALVGAQVGTKSALSVAYVIGVLLSYGLNQRWSFGRRAGVHDDFLRYATVYFAGSLLNLGAVWLFVGVMCHPHHFVQAVMVLVVAAFTFVLQKYWVFRVQCSAAQTHVGQPR